MRPRLVLCQAGAVFATSRVQIGGAYRSATPRLCTRRLPTGRSYRPRVACGKVDRLLLILVG